MSKFDRNSDFARECADRRFDLLTSDLAAAEAHILLLTVELDALRAEVARLHKRQIERDADIDRLRLEAAENKAYVERLCVEGDRLLAELARHEEAPTAGALLSTEQTRTNDV